MATILLVEDEDHVGNMVALKLEAAGHTVAHVPDGAQALELARSLRPELILLDLTLPVLDGLQTLRRLQEDPALESIPVIVLTARGEAEDIQALLHAGAADCVMKPLSLKDLSARVQEHLERGR